MWPVKFATWQTALFFLYLFAGGGALATPGKPRNVNLPVAVDTRVLGVVLDWCLTNMS